MNVEEEMKKIALVLMLALGLGCGGGGGDEDTTQPADNKTQDTQGDVQADNAVPDVQTDNAVPDVQTDNAVPDVQTDPGTGDSPTPVDPECENLNFVPCGGDPVGTWKVTGFCFDGMPGGNPFEDKPSCADDVYEFTVDFQGTVEFKADGTYNAEMGGTVTMHIELTSECLTDLGGGQAQPEQMCAGINQNFASMGGACVMQDTLCVCDVGPMEMGEEGETGPENGTWKVEGTNLVMTEEGGEPRNSPFCITGDTAVVENTEVDEESGETNTFHIILEKQ
jgi:hypothetical protein